MIKEELKKEAEEYYEDETEGTFQICEDCYWFADAVQTAYVDSAESRERQIQIDAEQIRALQKQNGELTDKVNELETQIEKMKWHDLRKDPNDLPKKNKSYWVYIDCQGNKIYRSIVWQGCWLGWNCTPLAWREEPQFKEIKEK